MMRNLQGFSLVEMLVALGVASALLLAVTSMLGVGQNVWTATDSHVQVLDAARIAVDRVAEEIRQTDVAHLTISDGTGSGGSDVVQFSIPVLCASDAHFLDSNGDIAYWGAPLTWGCEDSSCMDGDDDCSTVEYSKIEYAKTADEQLIRRVLDAGGNTVVENVIVDEGIVDFQVSLSGSVLALDVDVTVQTKQGRDLTETTTSHIFLRN